MDRELNILVVDDDVQILELIERVLSRNGMRVACAETTADADTKLESFDADLIVLDLMMAGEGGLDYCRRLRQTSRIPVIMLTALAEDIDRIVGLEVGADDYLPKPFNPRELVARIRAVMRRVSDASQGPATPPSTVLEFGHYRLHPSRLSLEHAEKGSITLTSGEFALLLALVENAPHVLSRDRLLDLSRGAAANPFDRSIDSQISRIRSKIEPDPRRPEFIKTIRNLGYAFAADIKRAPT
ncbi:MAG: response regulator [Maricaulis sp.]|uniref:response regulator n=1 Tax=Pseudomonadota TaxID=1224 RepID=UPI001B1D5235|nr:MULTISPECIES: response regulator [Pseudomonadota]MBO6813189.1 response regulator [Marinobacter sp.]MBO6878765.1 response regulator [Maricaulis sp.]